MATSQTESDDTLLDLIDTPVSLDQQEEEVRSFVEEALKNVRGTLRSNRREAKQMTDVSSDVDDVLDPDNVHEIQVRAKPFENPKITVWLSDCPIWANYAWKDVIHPRGTDAYNGKVTTAFDVRPF